MSNKLIENETTMYWTVSVNDGLFVKSYDERIGKIEAVVLTDNDNYAEKFFNSDVATNVDKYSKGKLLRHVRTSIVTEVIDEIKIEANE